jgi:hypothetical protein
MTFLICFKREYEQWKIKIYVLGNTFVLIEAISKKNEDTYKMNSYDYL